MIGKSGIHSYANFKGTDECPVSRTLDSCMYGCIYAKQCFAKHDNPDDALDELQAEHCDYCIFSSAEED